MELHQLRYFMTIAEMGNFTRAAERNNITQSSISQQILKLERELGHKLFHRLGRRAVPTETGLAFLERARRILAEVDDATRELRDDPTAMRRITVGATTTIAPYLLPRLLVRCRKSQPNLQVQTRENFRDQLAHAVAEGEIDLAIISLPVNDRRLSIEAVFSEPLLLVVGKKHRLAAQPQVTPTDLADETFILTGDGSSLADQIRRFCGDHDFEPHIGHRCSQIATVKALVSLGAGISILPQMVRAPGDGKSLVYRALSGRAPKREIHVLRHLQRYQSRGAAQFLTVLRETLASLPKSTA
ncbi:MAG TPA: LysR family transcriptional regulator [Opitutaceae bacterium]|jgi:LysR family hydrogen peroxide-inducible transcriptional activator|nr:LysR family transcriptional regulator [Opitutaceae bacterium]